MFGTPIVIVGNIVTNPVHRRVGERSVVKFRVASNSRRRTAEGTWEQGDTLYASVNCWNRLVTGAAASLSKGDPVIVVGDVYTTEYEDRDGNQRNSVEVRASAVGPNLAHCRATVDRLRRRDPAPGTADDSVESDDVDPGDVDDAPPNLSITA